AVSFFFFQAEDGIRDRNVTGVQTCALPIFILYMEVNTEMTLEKVVSTMSMVVARMEKMKAENLIGIGNHNQRKTKNHSNKDIDPSLSKLNYDLVNRTENYKTDIENFIN